MGMCAVHVVYYSIYLYFLSEKRENEACDRMLYIYFGCISLTRGKVEGEGTGNSLWCLSCLYIYYHTIYIHIKSHRCDTYIHRNENQIKTHISWKLQTNHIIAIIYSNHYHLQTTRNSEHFIFRHTWGYGRNCWHVQTEYETTIQIWIYFEFEPLSSFEFEIVLNLNSRWNYVP